ncbi:MAG: hypothetical protein K8Q99_08060 [Acholeplasmataceae bacterium]|nr:hypothetical protein [Acholeplasmataceae bacterium]
MKKLYFGLALMITGAMFVSGALIGGGAVMSGRNAFGYFSDIFDSHSASLFVTIGMIIFLVGVFITAGEVYKKDKE